MKIIEHTRIFNPREWGSRGISSAFSNDGQLIAVRVPCEAWSYKKQDNLFVYDIYGNKKWSGFSLDGGSWNEWGIVFFPDKYSVLVPGADDNGGSLDGLKQYKIGGNGFSLPFSHTSLNGINTSVYAAADNGRAILGRKNGLICVINKREFPMRDESFSEAHFSSESDCLAFIGLFRSSSWLYDLSAIDNKIELSGQFVCFLSNKQWLEFDRGDFVVRNISNLQEAQRIKSNFPNYSRIFSGAASEYGKLFTLADLDGAISLWDRESCTPLDRIKLSPNTAISRMKFSTDGQYILTVVMDGNMVRKEIIVWQIES